MAFNFILCNLATTARTFYSHSLYTSNPKFYPEEALVFAPIHSMQAPIKPVFYDKIAMQ